MTAEAINITPTPMPPPDAPNQVVRYVSTPTMEDQLETLGLVLGPEPTPTPAPVETPDPVDPFAESDEANAAALEGVEFGDEVTLENPRIVGVAEVRVFDMPLSDRLDRYAQVGIVATQESVVALVRNIDDCVVDPWQDQGVMGELEQVSDSDDVRLGLVDERIDAISAVVTIPSLPVTINGERYDLPLLSANSATLDGVEEECPSLAGGALDFLGDAVSPDSLRGLGRGVGEALGALLGGAAEGLDRGFND